MRSFAGCRQVARAAQHRGKASMAEPVAAASFRDIPGPRSWPLVGTLPDFFKRAGYKSDGIDVNKIMLSMYEEYGPVFSMNMPPFGKSVVVADPREYVQIMQNEGKFPVGAASGAWPFVHYHKKENNDTIMKIMENGQDWRDYRDQLQADILNPKAAKEYMPHIAEAVRLASPQAKEFEGNFDEFISRIAFDMFCALAVGRLTQTTNKQVANPRDLEFVVASMTGFSYAGQLAQEPHQQYLQGEKMKGFMASMRKAQALGGEIVNEVWEEMSSEAPPELVRTSYMAKLIRKNELSKEELKETIMMLLMAGVDTTGYITNWLMINLAANQERQDKLRAELNSVLGGTDLTVEHLDRLPYLKACIRESHRFSPPAPFAVMRPAKSDMTIGGYQVPKGTMCILHGSALTSSERLENADQFVPDRWMPDAVKARKADPDQAVLDHRLLATPFSAGARMCLGARAANLEIMGLTARLFQDYKMELEPDQTWGVKQGLFVKADPFPKFKLTRL